MTSLLSRFRTENTLSSRRPKEGRKPPFGIDVDPGLKKNTPFFSWHTGMWV